MIKYYIIFYIKYKTINIIIIKLPKDENSNNHQEHLLH